MSLLSFAKYWHSSSQKRFSLVTLLSWLPAPHPSTMPLWFVQVSIYLPSHGQCLDLAWKNWLENVRVFEGQGSSKRGHNENASSSTVWRYLSLTMQRAEVREAGLKNKTCPGKRSSPAIATLGFTEEQFTLLLRMLQCLEKNSAWCSEMNKILGSGLLIEMANMVSFFFFKSEKEGDKEDCEREIPETW